MRTLCCALMALSLASGPLLASSASRPAISHLLVPDIRGRNILQAGWLLSRSGLHLAVVSSEAASLAPEGCVLTQTPSPGRAARPGDAVAVNVSRGQHPFREPSLLGRTPAEAESVAERLGLHLQIVGQGGIVLTQTPPPGHHTTTLDVTVRLAPETVVPAVVGRSRSTAEGALQAAGLNYRIVSVRSSQPGGTVLEQRPMEGIETGRGGTVKLFVSDPR